MNRKKAQVATSSLRFWMISRFQIFCPFLNVAVNREEKLDLILLIFQVIILVGDDGHDLLFIQKRRELFAACAFLRFIL